MTATRPEVITNPPAPGTPQWRRLVTASKIPAMIRDPDTGDYMGVDYVTAFERWHQMAGTWSQTITPETQAMYDDARDAEDYGANVWLRAHPGWQANRGEVAYRDAAWDVPHLVTLDRRARRGRRRHIIEVKRPRKDSGVRDAWWAQVQFQMGISGIHEATIVIVPVYGMPTIHPVEFEPIAFERIRADAAAFHRSLEDGTPPAAGDSEHAANILAAINPNPDQDAAHEVPRSQMDELAAAWAELDRAQRRARQAENTVMEAMGDAARAVCDGRTVATRRAGRFARGRFPRPELLEEFTVSKPTLDTRALKAAHPDLYAAAVGAPSFAFERKAWT